MELLLLELNHTDTVPGVIMSGIEIDSLSEAGQSLVHLLDETVLVSEQIIRVDELRVELGGALEEFDRCVVFFVQAEAVAKCAPCFRG